MQLAVSNAHVLTGSKVLVSIVTTLMNAHKELITAWNTKSAKTTAAVMHVTASMVISSKSPFVKILTNVELIPIYVTLMQNVSILQEHMNVNVTRDTLVTVTSAKTLMNVMTELTILVAFTQFASIMSVVSPVYVTRVTLVKSHVGMSTNALTILITVLVMLSVLTMREALPANVRRGFSQLILVLVQAPQRPLSVLTPTNVNLEHIDAFHQIRIARIQKGPTHVCAKQVSGHVEIFAKTLTNAVPEVINAMQTPIVSIGFMIHHSKVIYVNVTWVGCRLEQVVVPSAVSM